MQLIIIQVDLSLTIKRKSIINNTEEQKLLNGAAGIVEGPECLERLEGLKGPKCHQRLQRLLCLGHIVHPERLKGIDSLEGLRVKPIW